MDSSRSRRRSSLCHCDHLTVLGCGVTDNRSSSCAVRQLYVIVRLTRTEGGIGLAVDRHLCQTGIATRGTLELDLIEGLRTTVLGFDEDARRRALQVTFGDGDLAAGQHTSRERNRLTTCVGERTHTTGSYDIRDRRCGLTQGIDLHFGRVRVKALPFLLNAVFAFDEQLLDLRGVDEFYVIDIQAVTGIETAVSAVVRVVGSREDDVHLGRSIAVEIVNRHADIRPVAVLFAFTPHSLGNLVCLGDGSALVTVQLITDIRLLVLFGDRGTLTVFAFELITHSRSRPCVVEEVEVLLVNVATGTFDPHGHRVRTVVPAYTAGSTGCRFADLGQALQIDPRLTE